jgi:hypothetical protein
LSCILQIWNDAESDAAMLQLPAAAVQEKPSIG